MHGILMQEKWLIDVGLQKNHFKWGIWLSFFFPEQNLHLKCISSLLELMSGCTNTTCFVDISQDDVGKQYECAHAWHFRERYFPLWDRRFCICKGVLSWHARQKNKIKKLKLKKVAWNVSAAKILSLSNREQHLWKKYIKPTKLVSHICH